MTRIIDLELDLHDRDTAELIKKYPLAKVESLLFLRFEDGSVKFLSEPLPPALFSRVVIVTEDTLVPIRSSKRLSICLLYTSAGFAADLFAAGRRAGFFCSSAMFVFPHPEITKFLYTDNV